MADEEVAEEGAPARSARADVERALLEVAAGIAQAQEAQARLAGAVGALLRDGLAAADGADCGTPCAVRPSQPYALPQATASTSCAVGSAGHYPQHVASNGSLGKPPSTWPSSLEIRWSEMGEEKGAVMRINRSASRPTLERIFDDARSDGVRKSLSDGGTFSKLSMFQWSISHTSNVYMLYRLLGTALLLYDITTVPLTIAWDFPMVGFLRAMVWITAVFWTIDIGVCFTTSFHINGELVDNIPAIANNYLRSYFVIDVVIVMSDWVFLLVTNSVGWRVARLAKVGRLLRLVAMGRDANGRNIFRMIEEKCSDYWKLAFRFASMFATTLFCAHIVSCAWFLIGTSSPSDTGTNWIRESGLPLSDGSVWYQYTTAFHWAMVQICLGSNEVVCATSVERIFSVMCMAIGLLFGTTLVSTLSTAMFQVQMDHRENYLMLNEMTRYLNENKIDHTFAAEVQRQLRARLATKDIVKKENVRGLRLLSATLREKLQFEVFAPCMKCHSLFMLWLNVYQAFAELFTNQCMRSLHLMREDDLFFAGKMADATYMLISGVVKYTQSPAYAHVDDEIDQDVESNSLISEAALWSHWFHVGTSQARQMCHVAEIRVAEFQNVVKDNMAIFDFCKEYCEQYHRRLQAARPPALPWPDDLQVPLTEWADMALSMSKDWQSLISLDALNQADHKHAWKRYQSSNRSKLTNEIMDGDSIIILDGDGELRRIVSLVAMRIYNEQGLLLIQMGKLKSGTMAPACQLPGGKQRQRELVMDTLQRLLETKMAPIARKVEALSIEREVETLQSKKFHIRTKYFRNVVHMAYGCSAHAPSIPAATRASRPSQRLSLIESLSPAARRRNHRQSYFSPAPRSLGPRSSHDDFLKRCKPIWIRDASDDDAVYAWLKESEFQQLQRASSEEQLSDWLEAAREKQAELGGDGGDFRTSFLEGSEHSCDMESAVMSEVLSGSSACAD